MDNLKDWIMLALTGLGLDLLALKSGLMGGFVSLAYEKKRTARQAVVSILAGSVLAGYLGPVAARFFDMEGATYGGVCFLVGLLSMRIVPMIITGAENFVQGKIEGFTKPKKNERNP